MVSSIIWFVQSHLIFYYLKCTSHEAMVRSDKYFCRNPGRSLQVHNGSGRSSREILRWGRRGQVDCRPYLDGVPSSMYKIHIQMTWNIYSIARITDVDNIVIYRYLLYK